MDATVGQDYYAVLGVARDADAPAIRDAFRTLALKFHPDRNKEPGAEARFKDIAQAYAVLSDPKKRAEYDAGGWTGRAGSMPGDFFAGFDVDALLRGAGIGAGGFDLGTGSLFDRFFGHGGKRQRRGRDIEFTLEVPLQKIATGGDETIRVARPVACTACGGSGAKAGSKVRPCESCGGSGREVRTRQEDGVGIRHIGTCPTCGGRGRLIDVLCTACAGSGSVKQEESLTVTVPVGVDEGTVLRVPGHGMPDDGGGAGAPGDLLVIVRSAPDPRFERDGADLWRAESIGIPDAVLGAERTVPTLDGNTIVRIPPGTQANAVLRLRGQGLPLFGGQGRGDLLVRLELAVPMHLSQHERALYEQLAVLQAARHPS